MIRLSLFKNNVIKDATKATHEYIYPKQSSWSYAMAMIGVVLLASSVLPISKVFAGGFSASCEGGIINFPHPGWFSTYCRDMFGVKYPASIYLNAILGNWNGVLGWDASEYIQTCSQCQIIGGHGLRCCCATNFQTHGPDACDNGHGGWTIKNLDERISNHNGVLDYDH